MSTMNKNSLPLYTRACIPQGMDAVLEGLTREVLKKQPRDIYLFAAEHFQELIRLRELTAHSAGVSPSSTQESDKLAPDSPVDIKERLPTEEQNHVEPVEATANGIDKTGAALAVTAGAATLVGSVAAAEEVLALAHQTREDVQKDAEEFVEEVVVEAEKEVEKITSPVPDSVASPSSPAPQSPEGGEIEDVDKVSGRSSSKSPVAESVVAEATENTSRPPSKSPIAGDVVESENTENESRQSSESPGVNDVDAEITETTSRAPSKISEGENEEVTENTSPLPSKTPLPEDIEVEASENGSRPPSKTPVIENVEAAEVTENLSRPPSKSPAVEDVEAVENASHSTNTSRPPSESPVVGDIEVVETTSRPASETAIVKNVDPEITENSSRPPSMVQDTGDEKSRPSSIVSDVKIEVTDDSSQPPSEIEAVEEPVNEVADSTGECEESKDNPDEIEITQVESPQAEIDQVLSPSACQSPDPQEVEAPMKEESVPIPDEERPVSISDFVNEAEEARPASIVETESKNSSRPQSSSQPDDECPTEDRKEINEEDETEIVEEKSPEVTESKETKEGGEASPINLPVVEEEISRIEASSVMSKPELADEEQSLPNTTASRAESQLEEQPESSPVENDAKEEDVADNTTEENSIANVNSDLAVAAATTIQATFRGHQTRQNLKKATGETNECDTGNEVEQTLSDDKEIITDGGENDGSKTAEEEQSLPAGVTEEELPPPIEEEIESDLTTTNEGSEVVDVTDVLEAVDDLPPPADITEIVDVPPTEGQSETEGAPEDPQVEEQPITRPESEAESLGIISDTPKSNLELEDDSRAASTVDSILAVKGSETESQFDAISQLSATENEGLTSAESNQGSGDADIDKMEMAATKIQATVRGYQTRKNLQQDTEDVMLPPPEMSEDFVLEEAMDDDLPPPPDECDLAPPPPPEDEAPEPVTPRSPETGEKVSRSVDFDQEDLTLPDPPDDLIGTSSKEPDPSESCEITAEALAVLQRPTECDELPEHRGSLANGLDCEGEPSTETEIGNASLEVDPAKSEEELPAEETQGLGNEVMEQATCDEEQEVPSNEDAAEIPPEDQEEASKDIFNEASSAEIDDSSLSSAATKIQAGARGYLVRKHMKDTFSTTAPSIADSQQSIGTAQSSQDEDDGVQTSGSVETEVQRHSMEDIEDGGIISVVISNASDKLIENGEVLEENIESVVTCNGISLDNEVFDTKKKPHVVSLQSDQISNGIDVEDEVVWRTLQSELEQAATKIQSSYRGFSTRQKLQRENAVQMRTTSSGSPVTTSEEGESVLPVRSSGEFHDTILPSQPIDIPNHKASS